MKIFDPPNSWRRLFHYDPIAYWKVPASKLGLISVLAVAAWACAIGIGYGSWYLIQTAISLIDA